VDLLGLLDNEPILHQLTDVLACKTKETIYQQSALRYINRGPQNVNNAVDSFMIVH
jgi:hypothetical protein